MPKSEFLANFRKGQNTSYIVIILKRETKEMTDTKIKRSERPILDDGVRDQSTVPEHTKERQRMVISRESLGVITLSVSAC